MPTLAWLTDLHVNFVPPERVAELARSLRNHAPDLVLVGGDTAEASSFAPMLQHLVEAIDRPLFFVLGNHDFYGSSIADVRRAAGELSADDPQLRWLPDAGVVALTEETVLIGHDGWGDGRCGDFLKSNVVLNDYLLIRELRASAEVDERDLRHGGFEPSQILTPRLLARLESLGDEAASHFERCLPEAAARGRHLIVLMHVPPFHEACWHDGRVADANWSPHFTCLAAGRVLAEFMRAHPHHRMTVLCGHTHSEGRAEILPNLEVLTGGAVYGEPKLQRLLLVD